MGALVVLVAVQVSVQDCISAGVQLATVISAPDDHFSCRSILPCERLAQRAR